MTQLNAVTVRNQTVRVSRTIALSAAVVLMVATAYAQRELTPIDQNPVDQLHERAHGPVYIIPGKPEAATLYHDGSVSVLDTYERWRYMCGSDLTHATFDELKFHADEHIARFADGADVIVDSGLRGAGIDIMFLADASVPAGALDGLARAETYIESVFADDILVVIEVSFGSIGSLGATSSHYRDNESYNNSRDGLINGMDADDVIQAWLPTGNTLPVRYNGAITTITDENRIDWTRANYNATVGEAPALAAAMVISNSVNWDYNPADGVPFTRYSFVDVVIHETGHALGFVSAADDLGESMKAMDIFRFQRTDGLHDYNPDTYEEFQTTPRLVDYNVPDDEHISDLIERAYRMEDGDPHQASHFREDSSIGIMGPTFANGQTYYPNYFSAGDVAMFDAIGYDVAYCPVVFTVQPEPSRAVCEGDNIALGVQVLVDAPAYQWRKGTVDLTDDGTHILGATTPTLMIIGFTAADDAENYNCLVTDTVADCSVASDTAELYVDTDSPIITSQPQSQVVTEGDSVAISVAAADPFLATYRWRKDGTPLSDDGHLFGTATDTLLILETVLADSGDYDCVLTSILGAQCVVTSDVGTLTVNPAGGDDCPEDLDGDETVGLGDLSTLLASYGGPGGPGEGDFDGDGDVDLADLAVLLAVYGEDCPTR